MPHGLSHPAVKAVLFDVDGTLVDSVEAIVRGLEDTFVHFFGQRHSEAQIRSLIGMPLRAQFAYYSPVALDENALAEMKAFAIARFEHYEDLETWFHPALDALRLCHGSGVRTALVTSKSAQELASFLPRFPGAAFVDATVCASDVSHPKPAPDSAFLACERLGVRPEEAVMVGDSVFDLRCARGAGVGAVAVAYGAAPREDLERESPDVLLDTPDALLKWVREALLTTPCAERS